MKPSSCQHYLLARVLLAIGATSAAWSAGCGGATALSDDTDTSPDDLQTSPGGTGAGNATPRGGTPSGGSSGGSTSAGGTASGGTGAGSDAESCGGITTTQCLGRGALEQMARAGYGQIPRDPLRSDSEVMAAFDENGCLRHDWVGSSCCNPALHAGVRDGESCCYVFCDGACCGRPLVISGQAVVAEALHRSDWIAAAEVLAPHAEAPALADEARSALARLWQADALMEHASIGSFARLSLQLLALGAPSHLVRGAQAAGLDEVRHAELAFAITSRFTAGLPVGPGALPGVHRDLPTDLLEVMVATIVEGCVEETLAALVALERAHVAGDPSIAAALATIAEDEVRHAELAFQIVAWALQVGAAPHRAAARGAFERALAGSRIEPALADSVDEEALHYFGRLSTREERLIQARGIEQVLRPALVALTGSTLNTVATRVESAAEAHTSEHG